MLNYNSRLKPNESKGVCGDTEYRDSEAILDQKIDALVELIQRSKYTVVLTGAGISTAAGIPDFRGPTGIWTKEMKGVAIEPEEQSPAIFNSAKPTYTHNALVQLLNAEKIHHIVSQNVDGLHLRSGIPPENISEVHGNIFMEICEKCKRKYFRDYDVGGMGLKYTGNKCEALGCRGKLRDFAIDWDTELPPEIMEQAEIEFQKADLVLCLGTSLRIRPIGNMPLLALKTNKSTKKKKGKIVIVNLQKTHLDGKSTIKIHAYCDSVLRKICQKLNLSVPSVSSSDISSSPDPDYFQEKKRRKL
jgi:mono-ADP-ribosyltransferase sirtuin 6